jgi:hypothetical protein
MNENTTTAPKSDTEMKQLMEHLTEAEYENLLQSRNNQDWANACDRVKNARNGAYPRDWFQRIILSGVMNAVLGPGSDQIKVVSVPLK